MALNYHSERQGSHMNSKDENALVKIEFEMRSLEEQLESFPTESDERRNLFAQLIPLQRQRMALIHKTRAKKRDE